MYSLEEPMRSNRFYLSQEKSARMEQIQASIARGLRQEFHAAVQPLPDRLADLVRKIEQSASGNLPEPA